MKREIICPICAETKLPHYPGEGHRKVAGYALSDFRCDGCGKNLPQNALCVALSIWAGNDYRPWEAAYLGRRSVLLEIDPLLPQPPAA